MSNFEDAYKHSMMFRMLSKDRLHASILLLTHQEAGQEPQYVSPYTRLAEEMYKLGYEAGKEEEPLKPAYFDPTYPPSDIGMKAFGKPVPQERCEEGYNFLLEAIGKNHTKVELDHYMTLAVRAVEKEKAAEFIEDMSKIIDVTGCYRLLAILCSGRTRPDPTPLGNKKDAVRLTLQEGFVVCTDIPVVFVDEDGLEYAHISDKSHYLYDSSEEAESVLEVNTERKSNELLKRLKVRKVMLDITITPV